jgi:hypothetical protein
MAAYFGGLALCMVAITGWTESQLASDMQRLAERNAYWAEVRK